VFCFRCVAAGKASLPNHSEFPSGEKLVTQKSSLDAAMVFWQQPDMQMLDFINEMINWEMSEPIVQPELRLTMPLLYWVQVP